MYIILDARVYSIINEEDDSSSVFRGKLLFNIKHCIKTLAISGYRNIKILAPRGISLEDFEITVDSFFNKPQISYNDLEKEISSIPNKTQILLIPPTLVFDKGLINFIRESNRLANICYFEKKEEMNLFSELAELPISHVIEDWEQRIKKLRAFIEPLPLIQINDCKKAISPVVFTKKILADSLFTHNIELQSIAPDFIRYKEQMGIVAVPEYYPLLSLAKGSNNDLSDSILIYSEKERLPKHIENIDSAYLVGIDINSSGEECLQSFKDIVAQEIRNQVIIVSRGLSSDIIRKILEISNRYSSVSTFLISDTNEVDDDISVCSVLLSDIMDYDSFSASVPEIIYDMYSFSSMSKVERINWLQESLFSIINAIWSDNSSDLRREFLENTFAAIIENSIRFIRGFDVDKQMAELYLSIRKYACTEDKSKLSLLLEKFMKDSGIISGAAKLFLGAKFWYFFSTQLYASDKGNRKWLDSSLAFMNKICDFYNPKEILHFTQFYIESLPIVVGSNSMISLDKVEYEFWNWLKINDNNRMLSDFPIDINSVEFERFTRVAESALDYEQSHRHISSYNPYSNINLFARYRVWLENYLIQAVQKIKLGLMKKVTDYCEQEGITHFLVDDGLYAWKKFGGFAKLNLQLRVVMNRSDFIKVTKNFSDVASYDESIGCMAVHDNNEYYWFPETRVYDKTSFCVEQIDAYFSPLATGVYITLAPIDFYGKSSIVSTIRYKTIHGINGLIQYRINNASRQLGWKGRLLARFVSPISNQRLRKIQWLVQGFCKKGSLACSTYSGNKHLDLVDASIYTDSDKVSFCDLEISVPKNYDALIEHKYSCFDNTGKLDSKIFKISLDGMSTYKVSMFSKKNYGAGKKVNSKGRIYIKLVKPRVSALKKHAEIFITKLTGSARTLGIHISSNTKVLASYKNKYKGQRCFLIGNGPSLRAEDLDMLQNETTFACNLIHNIYNQTAWRPSFLCISDSTITRTMSEEIVDNLGTTTMLIREFAYRYMKVKPKEAVKLPYISSDYYEVKGNVLAYHYISRATVMSMMIEIAIYMGFTEIYIIGVDGTSASGKGSHFVDHYFNKEMKLYADSVKKKTLKNYDPQERAKFLQDRSLVIYQQLKEFADKQGVSIYNATRGGFIEVFERKCLDDIIRR